MCFLTGALSSRYGLRSHIEIIHQPQYFRFCSWSSCLFLVAELQYTGKQKRNRNMSLSRSMLVPHPLNVLLSSTA
ncbi:hypothetical protein EYF80_035175 [Liparis tanakae]|uniref:Uncharacterized protein n=1 Tax=Liparis tanakae TaxID=230148 RepID=A0A4Z2GP64_9TELE|nr:hypothetical protein EYF80_035175 [Liparis tanakae]